MNRLFVYGSLRRGQQANSALRSATFVKQTRLPGFDLYALTWFPGVKENPNNREGVVGEIYEDVDDDLLLQLDYYEGYNRHAPERSLFLRKEVEVEGKPTVIYEFNRNPYDLFGTSVSVVRSGDWTQHKGEEI